MSIDFIHMWAEPKPGREFQYYLAWKHRSRTGKMMREVSKRPWRDLFGTKYRRVYKLWAHAVERTKIHGQDVIISSDGVQHD